MGFSLKAERETQNDAERREWKENVFDPSGRPTPTYLDTDNPDHYTKMLMDAARSLVSKDLQPVEVKDLYGSALKHYRQQFFDSAKAEAQRPTNIPEGELKQVIKKDATGRPFYEYYGSPSSWMSDFQGDKKRLVNIKKPRGWDDSYQKV